MREIKFKAIIKNGEDTFMTPVLDWIDFADKRCGWATYCGGTGESEENEAVYEKLLEYTGLNDSRGREIYEGDIVKRITKYVTDVLKEKGVVKWIDNECGFYVVDYKNEVLHKIENDFEIVGNIFENK